MLAGRISYKQLNVSGHSQTIKWGIFLNIFNLSLWPFWWDSFTLEGLLLEMDIEATTFLELIK